MCGACNTVWGWWCAHPACPSWGGVVQGQWGGGGAVGGGNPPCVNLSPHWSKVSGRSLSPTPTRHLLPINATTGQGLHVHRHHCLQYTPSYTTSGGGSRLHGHPTTGGGGGGASPVGTTAIRWGTGGGGWVGTSTWGQMSSVCIWSACVVGQVGGGGVAPSSFTPGAHPPAPPPWVGVGHRLGHALQ